MANLKKPGLVNEALRNLSQIHAGGLLAQKNQSSSLRTNQNILGHIRSLKHIWPIYAVSLASLQMKFDPLFFRLKPAICIPQAPSDKRVPEQGKV